MLLQQLAVDADRIVGELPPPMYDRKAVKWIIELDASGRFLGITPLTGDGGLKDKGQLMLVPHLSGRSGTAAGAILLADRPDYTLGVGAGSRVAACHARYVKLTRECLEVTGSESVRAILKFLESEPERVADSQELGVGDLITFRVDGLLAVDEASVRRFWADRNAPSDRRVAMCCVCGQQRTIPQRLPVQIQGIPHPPGSSASQAISSAEEEFESYLLRRGATGGVCHTCGERACKALNTLLRSEANRLFVGPTIFVFWTQEDVGFDFVTALSKPDVDQVRSLLSSYRSGTVSTAVDDSAFYATALSANSARAVVRDWLSTTVATAKSNLCRWFELTRQVDAWGKEGVPVGVYRLAAAPYRDASKQMHPALPGLLVRAALHGERLPAWIISAVLLRLRAESNVTYEQALLLKLALLSINPGKESYMSSLETEETSIAYSCGRALAVLEAIQRKALGKVNSTIVDKYFAAASSAPASVFGRLLSGAQPHLAKMRKSEQTKGAAIALERRLEEVLAPIDAFPTTLSLRDQALFALGYYHQRAADRAASASRSTGETAGNHDHEETEE